MYALTDNSECLCCGSQKLGVTPAILMPFVAERFWGSPYVDIDDTWHLKTVPSGRSHFPCFTVVCSDCGFIFMAPRPSSSMIERLYNDYRSPAYVSDRSKYEPDYAGRHQSIVNGVEYVSQKETFISESEPKFLGDFEKQFVVLDLGGNTGEYCPFRLNPLATCYVSDFSKAPLVEGVRRLDPESNLTFDLVVLSHVLEHVSDLDGFLLQLHSKLHENSLIYIELPLERAVDTGNGPLPKALSKRHWHEHINLFTLEAVKNLLDRAGYLITNQRITVANAPGNFEKIIQTSAILK